NRKANLGGLRPATGFEITFEAEQTTFKGVDVADVADLAGALSIYQRIRHLLRNGAMTPDDIATELDAKPDTVKRKIRRYKQKFTVLDGGRVGLAETRR
ncbi:MAG: hypothetical protein CL471_12315, partial [Acidobacteria bacterium]|nr:hypothetical protein [Acidobacteriota bacterium]